MTRRETEGTRPKMTLNCAITCVGSSTNIEGNSTLHRMILKATSEIVANIFN
jgi:hypothetical protein